MFLLTGPEPRYAKNRAAPLARLPVLRFPSMSDPTKFSSRSALYPSSRLCELRLAVIHQARTSGLGEQASKKIRQARRGFTRRNSLCSFERKETADLYTKVQTSVLPTSRIRYVSLRGSIRHIHPEKCAAGRDAVRIAESQLGQLAIRIFSSCCRPSSCFRPWTCWASS